MSTRLKGNDPLYEIFEEFLHSGQYDHEPLEIFVHDVVEKYWAWLLRNGHIPFKMQDSVKSDLIRDVQDMLRAKIYGHYGIGEYNSRRRKKTS